MYFRKNFAVLTKIYSSLLLLAAIYSNAAAKPVGLQCEHLNNPLGIDALHPRLSWRMDDPRQGARQTAYQLIVGTDSAQVAKGAGTAWQTAEIKSHQMLVNYQGKPLHEFTKYYWCVRQWDKDHKALLSSVASFETAMLNMDQWKGYWISDHKSIDEKAAPYFRHEFSIKKKIVSARAYIVAAGLYELYINGQRIGDHRLDPMYTRFDRRNLYVTYDVTAELQKGKNALGILLGNGWYNHQSTAVWYFDKAWWRARPAFCMDLRITYSDGTVETVVSDASWKTALSPVVFNSIYTGEHYDARLEQPGWNKPGFNDTTWKDVLIRPAPSEKIISQTMVPIRNVLRIPVKAMHKINDTAYVFDMGRNFSGVSQLTVKGEAGTVIRLQHAERLYKNGRADQSNIIMHYRPHDDLDPFQTDIFTLSGKGEETFMPRFNYKGFQYVEITSSKPIHLTEQSLVGWFMHSDVNSVGHISSSNPIIDKIWQATNNSYLSNLFGYPTDCPQREKNGWTGDAHIAIETGLYNFDGISIYEKWMNDHRDEQQPNGVFPATIPSAGWGYEWANGPDWTSTIAIIPWKIYEFYGDKKVLVNCYDNIRKYVEHINYLYPSGLTTWGLGDWVPVKSQSPVELTSSIYYYTDVNILAKAAKLIGKTDDYNKYSLLAEKIKDAINKKYLNVKTGVYGSGYQTEQSAPLYWGIVPEQLKPKVAANLAKAVADANYHLDVGILGAKAILTALSDNGYADVAYKIAAQTTYPSWGWWMVNGATTLYENWNIDSKSDISLNHIMFGEIGAWLYKGIGGIKPDAEHPGFSNIIIEPHFVSGLTHFEAEHDAPQGKIISAWKRNGSDVDYHLIIPANATASLRLPKGSVMLNGKPFQNTGKLVSGTYDFKVLLQ